MAPPPRDSIPASITTTQRFSRRGVGFLWNKRSELDPGQVSILNALYNNRKKSQIECEQEIIYRLSKKKAGLLGYGRYYGTKGSLETLEKECRGTVCSEFYHDIDIVNCHPVILSQYAKRFYDRDLPENDYYVDNRDKVLRAISADRNEAKDEVIRILYGGSNRHDITAKLSAEIRAFSRFLSQQPEHKKLFEAVKHEDNIYGSLLSFILQTEERECMLVMKKVLEEDGWSVDVLAYDGVMVRKRNGVELEPSMRKVEAAIKEQLGYTLRIVDKEFSSFEIPKTEEEIIKGVPLSAYEDMKLRFEETHFFHAPTGQIVEVKEELLFMKKEHARDLLNPKWNFKHSDKFADYTPFLDLWLKDPNRLRIDSISLKPSNDPTVFSPPLAWAWKRCELPADAMEYVSMFTTFITTLIPNQQDRQTLLEWIAHLLQRPFENPKSAIVLVGEKGCGKDTLGDFLCDYIFGQTLAINYEDNEQFWAPHDSGRLNKLLVKVEEADGVYMRKYYSKLKAIITSDTAMFNPKGAKEIRAANYNRFVFTANPEESQIPTEIGERRFTMIYCAPDMVGKLDEVFRPLRSKLFTPEGGRAVAEYLLSIDCGVWPRVLIASELQIVTAESQESPEDRFIKSWDGVDVSATDLYDLYRDFCSENNLPVYSKNSMSLGKKLIRYIAKGTIKRRMVDGKSLYSK